MNQKLFLNWFVNYINYASFLSPGLTWDLTAPARRRTVRYCLIWNILFYDLNSCKKHQSSLTNDLLIYIYFFLVQNLKWSVKHITFKIKTTEIEN